MNSSKSHTDQTLARITPRQARTFLLELANLSDDLKATERFEDRFGHMVPLRLKGPVLREGESSSRLLSLMDPSNPLGCWSVELRDGLRAIWEAPDQRTKDWGIFRLIEEAVIEPSNPRSDYALGVFHRRSGRIDPLPPPTPLEQILIYLRKQAHRTRVCANSDCPAPYFFAERRSQKYCSEVCSLPSQRQFKRLWWARHGKSWRRKRAKT